MPGLVVVGILESGLNSHVVGLSDISNNTNPLKLALSELRPSLL